LQCCKATLWGEDRLLVSPANIIIDGSTVRLQSDDPGKLSLGIFPPPPRAPTAEVRLAQSNDGIMGIYSATVPSKDISIQVHQVQSAGPLRPLQMGPKRKPLPPTDADFDSAAVWQINPPPDALDGVQNTFLKIDYVGDAARVYIGDKLIDDDFYYGPSWEIGLKRFAPQVLQKGITLKILPLPTASPVYIQSDRQPDHRADLLGVEPEFVYQLAMQCGQ
jgi:beta-galactosidase